MTFTNSMGSRVGQKLTYPDFDYVNPLTNLPEGKNSVLKLISDKNPNQTEMQKSFSLKKQTGTINKSNFLSQNS